MRAREAALESALAELRLLDREIPTGVFVVSGEQWQRGLADADLQSAETAYASDRATICELSDVHGPDIARRLRPQALAFAASARDLCRRLELLAAQAPGDGGAARAASDWRRAIATDACGVLAAIVRQEKPSGPPERPSLPSVADDNADVLLSTFAVPSSDLADQLGAFNSSRLLAAYRLKLDDLERICTRILSLVGQPPSVFSGAGLARDLITSASPFVTLDAGRVIRRMFLDAMAADAGRAWSAIAVSWDELDKEWSSFDRLGDRLRRAEGASTDRERCIALLEAYKHMAEGLTRRWVCSLLCMTGAGEPGMTVGQLVEPARARLGQVGAWLDQGLLVAARNAEAHEDFEFDELVGVLRAGDTILTEDELISALTQLDVLQRAWVIGRGCALAEAEEPSLTKISRTRKASERFRVEFASGRFGHAGQKVRSFERDRQLLEIELDELRSEACNPCFVALVQSAAVLPDVSRFVVRVRGTEDPIMDLPSSVLLQNWPVFEVAAGLFPHALPQATFIPCLTWVRLAVEPLEEAARVAAWFLLNDAQHAVNDAEVDRADALMLVDRLRLVAAAGDATVRILPRGPHLVPLERAIRIIEGTADALRDGLRGVAGDILLDRILRVRDRLGERPPVLPTLDPRVLPEGCYPHVLS